MPGKKKRNTTECFHLHEVCEDVFAFLQVIPVLLHIALCFLNLVHEEMHKLSFTNYDRVLKIKYSLRTVSHTYSVDCWLAEGVFRE